MSIPRRRLTEFPSWHRSTNDLGCDSTMQSNSAATSPKIQAGWPDDPQRWPRFSKTNEVRRTVTQRPAGTPTPACFGDPVQHAVLDQEQRDEEDEDDGQAGKR
jgi:hypothetical protein